RGGIIGDTGCWSLEWIRSTVPWSIDRHQGEGVSKRVHHVHQRARRKRRNVEHHDDRTLARPSIVNLPLADSYKMTPHVAPHLCPPKFTLLTPSDRHHRRYCEFRRCDWRENGK